MSGEEGRQGPPVTWGALALIALTGGLLFAGAATATGTVSPVVWIDVGVCLVLAVVFVLVQMLSQTGRVRISPRESRIRNGKNIGAILLLTVAVLTPPITGAAKLAGLADPSPAVVIEQSSQCSKAQAGSWDAGRWSIPSLS